MPTSAYYLTLRGVLQGPRTTVLAPRAVIVREGFVVTRIPDCDAALRP